MPSDLAHKLTDKELAALERRIARVYREAAGELAGTITAYFEAFAKRDAEMRKLIGQMVNGKVWTEQDYKRWRLNQIGRGERYIALRDAIARRMTQANEVAVAYVNDATPGIYTLNRNYAAYAIAQVAGDVGFTLWDEQAVKRLSVEDADVMPYYPPERALRRGIDLAYGKKQITKSVTSGLLQGKSVGKIATDLQARVMEMNRASAVRAARTAVTAAQNGGRMDSYRAAEAMGIRLQKEWLATLDNRTRHAHALLDGQRADVDAPFRVEGREIRYPGDPQAAGDLVYNCRCTLVAAVEGADAADAKRRAKDPETGESVVVRNMSFAEWESQKKAENATAWETYMKKGKNLSSDREQHEEYRKVLGKGVPKTLDGFQNLKYNSPEKWETVKQKYRYIKRVPEATDKDFELYRKIKETGIIGSVRVPPHPIDANSLKFRDEHGKQHGCTIDDAISYVKTARFSVTRKRWDGISYNYYSDFGAAYIDRTAMAIKTAFPKEEFDQATKKAMEVFA